MALRRLLRPLMIATAASSLAACTVVDRAVLATENGASRILAAGGTTAPVPPAPDVDLQSLVWQKLSPSRPDDDVAQIAIVGTDTKTGATRVALKVRPGETLPVYWQEVPQTYTVLNGTFVAEGIDSTGQPARIVQGPGTFARIPARMIQRLHTKPGAEAVMLLTVYGEWKPNFVDDEPRPAEVQRAAN